MNEHGMHQTLVKRLEVNNNTMRLSDLQKYILNQIWGAKKIRINRDSFSDFYKNEKKAPSKLLQTKIITKSL